MIDSQLVLEFEKKDECVCIGKLNCQTGILQGFMLEKREVTHLGALISECFDPSIQHS